MFEDVSLPLLLGIFAATVGAIWYTGTELSDMTDVLSTRLGRRRCSRPVMTSARSMGLDMSARLGFHLASTLALTIAPAVRSKQGALQGVGERCHRCGAWHRTMLFGPCSS